MKKWLTVRAGYLYILTGSALISGVILFLTYRFFVWAYTHVSSESFLAKLAHGLVNYIGRTPIAVIVFIAVFACVFMLRSQKLADDMKSIEIAARELAEKGSFTELKVGSIGELREISNCLHRIHNAQGRRTSESASLASSISTGTTATLGNEELMTLILRIKSLLRALEGEESIDDGKTDPRDYNVEAVKQEVRGLERLLESLMNGL